MTRQYKSTDEELRERQASLENEKDANAESIETLEKKKREIEGQIEATRVQKEEELRELQTYIETMHSNFSTMLKKTLEKMKGRIQAANEAWEQEQDSQLINKFKEIIDNGQPQP